METEDNFIYSRPVLDFITVCTEYCKFLEHPTTTERTKFIDVMRGLLPMLYLKASLLGKIPEEPGFNEPCVTEEDYDFVRTTVSKIMGDKDDYLDVFVEDFKYSDQAVLCTISENLADIYQIVRDLVESFRSGYEESMHVAVAEAMAEFELQWGQKLLNALKALHDVRFSITEP